MRDHTDAVECLELAKQRVSRMAWALSLHLPSGMGGGGAYEVQREGEAIGDWIDGAIERIKADAPKT
jgi:hypothetical protein